MPVPPTHMSPAMAYHGRATRVASAHVPQALFVGFAHPRALDPDATHIGNPRRRPRAQHTAPLLGRDAHRHHARRRGCRRAEGGR
jgi:hypothetical protein